LKENKKESAPPGLILVTGATGYIGGRLVPHLLNAGYRVRCFVRDSKRLYGFPWFEKVEVAEGDVLDRDSLWHSLQGIAYAYYLIHGLQGGQKPQVYNGLSISESWLIQPLSFPRTCDHEMKPDISCDWAVFQ
jgi:hypothetical protein